jgi:hypothetical protein
VPNAIFPVPEFHSEPSRAVRTRPSLAVRMRTHWGRSRLDDELARATDPSTSAELSLRAAQLRSFAERSRLANELVKALGDARGPNLGAFRAKTRRQHARIRQYSDELLALVRRLRGDQPIDVRGAAMTARLVNNRAGPLYREGGQDLQDALLAARDALEVTHRGTHVLARAA